MDKTEQLINNCDSTLQMLAKRVDQFCTAFYSNNASILIVQKADPIYNDLDTIAYILEEVFRDIILIIIPRGCDGGVTKLLKTFQQTWNKYMKINNQFVAVDRRIFSEKYDD